MLCNALGILVITTSHLYPWAMDVMAYKNQIFFLNINRVAIGYNL